MTRDAGVSGEQGQMLPSTTLDEDILDEPALEEGYADEATLTQRKRLWWRNAIINLAFIGSWYAIRCNPLLPDSIFRFRYFFATLLSVYNKWMFSPEHFGFPFPLFVTMLHMFVQFILAAALRYAWPSAFRPDHSPTRRDYT